MSQPKPRPLTPFEVLCNFIDLSQGNKGSVSLIQYQNINILNELTTDLRNKFKTLNIIEINSKQPSNNFMDVEQLIKVLSPTKEPELLIVKGYENEIANLSVLFLAREFACPIVVLLPEREMSVFMNGQGRDAELYLKF